MERLHHQMKLLVPLRPMSHCICILISMICYMKRLESHQKMVGDGLPKDRPTMEAENFFKLIKDGQREIYPRCTKFSKRSFIIQLFLLKCPGRWTNKSFTMLLKLLKEVLPEGECLPKSYYETKK
ncbi:hypothetical protein CFOL_v3_15643 [Cephalotus follicularis]|uniref:Uncharacterized protein n=1 Tax=Cephalotus follicularis TaxID=3775 RepID=A0A1Q3BVV5_CEPFO|nr:hypothetical protein CFOL_v3_15643 [Cephalotus follicularis]